MTDMMSTPLEVWTNSDTAAGWLLVTPEMRSDTDIFDHLPARAPFGLWVKDAFWDNEEDYYELNLTPSSLWCLPDLDRADIWEHPERYRALYLTATPATRTRLDITETMYTVIESVSVGDLMIDPADRRYDRLRELLSQGDHHPWEPALHSPEQNRAATLAYGALHRYGFGWIEQECTGTNDFYAALALRPHIGQFEGWDQAAYDTLRQSFEHYRGELLHPEDAHLTGIAYKTSINGSSTTRDGNSDS
ncbi:hypothetical protein [Mycobacteroides abscessus]|uniref:hypothetical protein n=1 Tax=Mycobacteroides abscessus TaxID=36809 RepID=UPI00092B3BC6|nr:hypothetical protein [Mycobacteroides abscessus]SII82821.1 Uncharacterised protein [Mycobacteroides abscessus subsp. abscessus]SIK58289.1 Uncharacterised protein [Mycobacteroides abscessus subsp. abscessus]SIL83466.1 Uncharacterised protein [Mycobacteroides abscessus subsp. abscessus]SIM13637.1 Uncharacterised protein [Mycobacteroides abscessus subsp. abscessus]SIM34218.1 Uncharacterised protein [Mycobacteroides abscessus subsp. abscessus]